MKSPYFILLCHLFLLFSCNRSQNTKNNFLKNFIPSHDIEITVLDSTDLVVDFIPSMVKMKDKIIELLKMQEALDNSFLALLAAVSEKESGWDESLLLS